VRTGGDEIDEGDEHFWLLLTDGRGAEIGDSMGTGTILDNELEPLIRAGDITVLVGDEATFVVSLSNPYKEPVTVDYRAVAHSAHADVHFEPTAGTLTFEPGETVARVAVPTLHAVDNAEKREFTLALSNPTAASVEAATATATLIRRSSLVFGPLPEPDTSEPDMMPMSGSATSSPSLTVSDASCTEGGSMTFSVTLSDADPSSSVTVTYSTAHGTSEPDDF